MKIKVNKKDLVKHISIVQRAITQRTTMQILEGILVKASNNKLTLIASDTEITIITSLSAIVESDMEFVVNSKIFGDIIRKLAGDSVDIEITSNNMNIKNLNSEFNIQIQSNDDFPNSPKVDESSYININSEDLKKAIKKTTFAVSADELRAVFTGVYLDIKESKVNFVALDGFRMALESIDLNAEENLSSIIPARSLNEILKIIDDEKEIKMYIGKTSIKFELNNTVLFTSLISGEFFRYETLIRNESNIKVNVNRNELLSALDRASLLSENKANLVKLEIEDNYIKITSNSEIGNVEEIVKADISGESLKIAFNSRYLMEGLKIIESENVILNFTDSINPCIIKQEEDENYIYLVLPVRLAN